MLHLSTYGVVASLFYLALLIPAAAPRPSIPSLRANPTLDHDAVYVSCYNQPPHGQEHVPRVEIEDCKAATRLISIGDKTDAPMDFSHDETKGYFVPKTWGCGRCQLILHVVDDAYESAVDTFSLALVAHVAKAIIAECVILMPAQLGGDAKLGPKKIFELIVAGVISGPNDACSVAYPEKNASVLIPSKPSMPMLSIPPMPSLGTS